MEQDTKLEQTTMATTELDTKTTETCLDQVAGCEHDVTTSETGSNKAEENAQVPVSFEDIDPTKMTFSTTFKCARSTAGQVVQGFHHLRMQLEGEGTYASEKKVPTNDYQKSLYPGMSKLAGQIVEKFNEKFVTGVTDPLQRQVFGANLNGSRNNGQLNKFIPCKQVDRFLRYKFAQFGQLLNLLNYRLMFIANRDPQYIKRYKENPEEHKHFETLRGLCREFCDYLKKDETSVSGLWAECIVEARKLGNVTSTNVPDPVKLTADEVAKKTVGHQQGGYQKKPFHKKPFTGPKEGGDGWNVVSSRSGGRGGFRSGAPRSGGFRNGSSPRGGSRGGSRGGFRGRGGYRTNN